MRTQKPRLLIRGQIRPKLGLAGNRFESNDMQLDGGWQGLEALTGAQLNAGELWELAYEAAEKQGAEFAEPDFEQSWQLPARERDRSLLSGAGNTDRGIVNKHSSEFPQGSSFAWHLGDEFSQLALARQDVESGHPKEVRIAILDVGYDLKHLTRPEFLRPDLGCNFSDDGKSDDIRDPDEGSWPGNPGHGTATIAILAGGKLSNMKEPTPSTGDYLGGAPRAEIVPLRVAESVVLWRTSAFAEAIKYLLTLNSNPETRIDVVSMSMGGLASEAWVQAVNSAYDKGLFLVTAAGNNFGLPKSIVYPARFRRVLAACGVMADFRPYADLWFHMSGNYGPDSKMDTALAAFTPNIPWAEIGSPDIVDWDGQGTSSATPQIAAAAALWLQKHKSALTGWQPWQVVEMIRHALFTTADKDRPDKEKNRKYFGQGILKAHAALQVAPSEEIRRKLKQQPPDNASLAFWKALLGRGVRAENEAMTRMMNLELTQLLHRDPELEKSVADPDLGIAKGELDNFIDAVVASPFASNRLKEALKSLATGQKSTTASLIEPLPLETRRRVLQSHPPPVRRLYLYAFDPLASQRLETAVINETVVEIPWEKLCPGPCGEYLEVIDHDPASGCFYAPLDLNLPDLLASDGLRAAHGRPQFHQQMVYAVGMRTIQAFEKALGRKALWSPRIQGRKDDYFVRRLRIYPHALRAQNAYYDPEKKALLFGYFPATTSSPGELIPGGLTFTCLSHDIVAHEISHALLDGIHRRLNEPTNCDMLAFHEAFADLVALFQHFSLPGVLEAQLANVRGDLRDENLMGQLAQEFGQATGLHGALRSAIGKLDPQTGKWQRLKPDPADYQKVLEPHDRGAILVAAVFDAYLAIYENRTVDLRRIASNGTGLLPEGELHPDLIRRFAAEASLAAEQVLEMCIRAIDYCPPVDLTFGDFLRALITADTDLWPNDIRLYRVAFVDAFRKRGIYPRDVRALSEDVLRWRTPDLLVGDVLKPLFPWLGELGNRTRDATARTQDAQEVTSQTPCAQESAAKTQGARGALFHLLRDGRGVFHNRLEARLKEILKKDKGKDKIAKFGEALGMDFGPKESDPKEIKSFEILAINFSDRRNQDGSTSRDVIIWIVQEKPVENDRYRLPGGCTIIAGLDSHKVRYVVYKNIHSDRRRREFIEYQTTGRLRGITYFRRSPFAGLHYRFAALHSFQTEEDSYA